MGMETTTTGLGEGRHPQPEQTVAFLIKRSATGDVAAFTRLVELHQRYAHAVAARFLGDEEEARDVTQEVFLKIWRHIGRIDPEQRFSTWMVRVVINACTDRIRRRRPQLPLADDIPSEDAGPDPETREIRGQFWRVVSRLSLGLPRRQREVFVLRDLQDLDAGEVARILGISLSAVKSNLCLARRTMRGRLQALEKRQGVGHEL